MISLLSVPLSIDPQDVASLRLIIGAIFSMANEAIFIPNNRGSEQTAPFKLGLLSNPLFFESF